MARSPGWTASSSPPIQISCSDGISRISGTLISGPSDQKVRVLFVELLPQEERTFKKERNEFRDMIERLSKHWRRHSR